MDGQWRDGQQRHVNIAFFTVKGLGYGICTFLNAVTGCIILLFMESNKTA